MHGELGRSASILRLRDHGARRGRGSLLTLIDHWETSVRKASSSLTNLPLSCVTSTSPGLKSPTRPELAGTWAAVPATATDTSSAASTTACAYQFTLRPEMAKREQTSWPPCSTPSTPASPEPPTLVRCTSRKTGRLDPARVSVPALPWWQSAWPPSSPAIRAQIPANPLRQTHRGRCRRRLRLLTDGAVDHIINDLNVGVARVQAPSPPRWCQRILSAHQQHPRHRGRAVEPPEPSTRPVRGATLPSLGFATFPQPRTNRSGILDAGPIGGFEQVGKWVPAATSRRLSRKGQTRAALGVPSTSPSSTASTPPPHWKPRHERPRLCPDPLRRARRKALSPRLQWR